MQGKEIDWLPFHKDSKPDEGDEILVTLQIDYSYGKGTDIQNVVDIAVFSEFDGYISVDIKGDHVGFVDTWNDWYEGQPIEVTAWWPKPMPYTEKPVDRKE